MKNSGTTEWIGKYKNNNKKGVNHEKEIQMSRMRLCLRR